jgi:addiction module RelE/StbE family toxin
MVEVKWTAQALIDLDDIGNYISKDSARYADITVQKLFYSTEILERQPFAGQISPEFYRDDIRELVRGNYRIVYRIVDNGLIDIMTVHHCKRLMKNNPHLKDLFDE